MTTEGGQAPVWSPSGERLFYRRYSAMMAVEVFGMAPPRFGPPELLFDGGWSLPNTTESWITPYDVSADGESFVMIRHEPAAIPYRIDIVLGWFDELDRLVSEGGAG